MDSGSPPASGRARRYIGLGIGPTGVFWRTTAAISRSCRPAAPGSLRRSSASRTRPAIVGMVAYCYRPKVYLGSRRGIKGHEDFIDAVGCLRAEGRGRRRRRRRRRLAGCRAATTVGAGYAAGPRTPTSCFSARAGTSRRLRRPCRRGASVAVGEPGRRGRVDAARPADGDHQRRRLPGSDHRGCDRPDGAAARSASLAAAMRGVLDDRNRVDRRRSPGAARRALLDVRHTAAGCRRLRADPDSRRHVTRRPCPCRGRAELSIAMYRRVRQATVRRRRSPLLLVCVAPLLLVAIARGAAARSARRCSGVSAVPASSGRPFTLIKFRTMTGDRDASGQLLPDAERMTALGSLLRSSSLDELPELVERRCAAT